MQSEASHGHTGREFEQVFAGKREESTKSESIMALVWYNECNVVVINQYEWLVG